MGRCETGVGMTNNVDEFLDFISGFNLVEPECIHQTIRCLLDDLGAILAGSRMPAAEVAAKFAVEHLPATPKERCTVLAGGNASLLVALPLPMVLPQTRWISSMDHDRLRGDREPASCL